jgi:hypothetical protein
MNRPDDERTFDPLAATAAVGVVTSPAVMPLRFEPGAVVAGRY